MVKSSHGGKNFNRTFGTANKNVQETASADTKEFEIKTPEHQLHSQYNVIHSKYQYA